MAAIARNLPAKTGRSLEEWVRLARARPGSLMERVAWLKAERGLGSGQARAVAVVAERGGLAATPEAQLLDEQYAGRKEPLRPLHEALRAVIEALFVVELRDGGPGVTVRR